jgi:hypothetical protein
MGKVHGSLARAGKVRGQTPKGTFSIVIESSRASRGGFFYRIPARAPGRKILLLFAAKEALLLGFCVRDGENRRSELRRERRGANMRGSETCGDHNARIRLRVIAFSFCSFSFACISCVVSRFTDI